jgi:hypothetical protein
MISRTGFLVLVALTPLLVLILPAGDREGWSTGHALEGLLSGVEQELYFRAALLPAVIWLLPGRFRLALMIHAGLFVTWHLRMFAETPPLAWIPNVLVLFTAGTGWGRQVYRDRTLVWAALQHSFFLIAMSLFGLA